MTSLRPSSMLFAARVLVASLPVLAVGASPSPATAQARPSAARPSAVSPDELARALVRIEGVPGDAYFASLGPSGLTALGALLDDAQRPLAIRRRAATVVRSYRTPEAVALLTRVAERANEDPGVVRYALASLVVIAGDDALPVLRRALTDARPMVREGAVVALGQLRERGSSAAEALLRQHAGGERATVVLAAIERALAP